MPHAAASVRGQPVFAGDTGVLNLVGLTSAAPARDPLQAAQDAEFKREGFIFFRPTNTVTDALSDVTISLLKTNEGAPLAAGLDFERGGEIARNLYALYTYLFDIRTSSTASPTPTSAMTLPPWTKCRRRWPTCAKPGQRPPGR